MRFSSLFLTAAAGISALPLNQTAAPCPNDTGLLQFLLYMKNFQNAFYRQGLANYTQADFAAAGFDTDFYTNLTDIASHAHTHVSSLTTTLNNFDIPLIAECSWDFNVTMPATFVVTANLIESVAVDSFLGSVAKFQDPALATLVSSIQAVDARHSSFIRAALGLDPFPTPFETSVEPDWAYDLAELFTISCPDSNPPLNLKKFNPMSSSFSNHGVVGRDITLRTFGQDIKPAAGSDQIYAAFLTLTGPVFSPVRPYADVGFKVTVPAPPAGHAPINGFTYVVLTSFNDALRDEDILAGPATLEIYLD